MTVEEFVLDDFQEAVWYDGVVQCPPAEELAKYFDEFISDCHESGRFVPEGLTPELYYTIWMEEYDRRMEEES